MIGRRQIEAAFVAYVRSVWGEAATGKVIRMNEKGERPPFPYVAVSVLADRGLGHPVRKFAVNPEPETEGFDLDETSRQDRIVAVSLHVFGKAALDEGLPERLEASHVLEPGRTMQADHGVSILTVDQAVDVSALRDPAAIERHFVIDFRCHVVRVTDPRAILSAAVISIEREIVGGHKAPDSVTEAYPAEEEP